MLAVFCSGGAIAGGEGWSSDFAAAKKEAAESKKDLLIDFTGSDWCSWCIKLNEEVFSHEPFKAGVKDKFVLVELDYPKDQSKLSAETIKQNEELKEKYPIEGYPTILLADAEGRPFAITSYQNGGPEAYVKHLDELRAKKTTRDESFAAAAKASGVDKAKALLAALEAMDLGDAMVLGFYSDVVKQIEVADPKDETGFMKAAAAKARFATFETDLNALGEKEDFDGALALVNKNLKDGGFSTDNTQQIMVIKGMIYAQQKKTDEAIKALDEAKAFAPDSEMSANIDGLKKQIEASNQKPDSAE